MNFLNLSQAKFDKIEIYRDLFLVESDRLKLMVLPGIVELQQKQTFK